MATKKTGRPERSKQSYQVEVQKLKTTIKGYEDTIKELTSLVDEQYKTSYKYRFPTIKQRIKFLITGEL